MLPRLFQSNVVSNVLEDFKGKISFSVTAVEDNLKHAASCTPTEQRKLIENIFPILIQQQNLKEGCVFWEKADWSTSQCVQGLLWLRHMRLMASAGRDLAISSKEHARFQKTKKEKEKWARSLIISRCSGVGGIHWAGFSLQTVMLLWGQPHF